MKPGAVAEFFLSQTLLMSMSCKIRCKHELQWDLLGGLRQLRQGHARVFLVYTYVSTSCMHTACMITAYMSQFRFHTAVVEMFLCLPEHRCRVPLLEQLCPVTDGGGHWNFVLKENMLPMYIVTLLPDRDDRTTELTMLASDGERLNQLMCSPDAAHIIGLDCAIRTSGSNSWKTRSVDGVWGIRGYAQHAMYMSFLDEPGVLFDTYTFRKSKKSNADSRWIELLNFQKRTANGRQRAGE